MMRQLGGTREEWAAFRHSIGRGADAELRPSYPLTADVTADCAHGRGCKRCALWDGAWHDFGL